MKLTELQLSEFVNVLGSDAPAPGGGSASALAGSIGIALTAMVGCLTVGKAKYQEHEELMKEIITESTQLKESLVSAIDRDTESFNGVTAVFKMPKETDLDKEARKNAMQLALKEATKVPYSIMVDAQSALEITSKAVGKSNTNAASDLGVAALNLKSAIQGAWLNVLINLSGIKDDGFVNEYKTKGEEILEKSLPLADKIYNEILKSL